MNRCSLPASGHPTSSDSRLSPQGSRIHRFQPAADPAASHTWQGVPVQSYKPAGDPGCGVMRSVIVGDSGERTQFQVRYFEIASGGNTTLEHHLHEHVVVVLRGRGEVRLGDHWHALGFGDALYVAPHEVHQLRNTSTEPFGFLCMVDAQRDVGIAVG